MPVSIISRTPSRPYPFHRHLLDAGVGRALISTRVNIVRPTLQHNIARRFGTGPSSSLRPGRHEEIAAAGSTSAAIASRGRCHSRRLYRRTSSAEVSMSTPIMHAARRACQRSGLCIRPLTG